jgi:hypothetical protein
MEELGRLYAYSQLCAAAFSATGSASSPPDDENSPSRGLGSSQNNVQPRGDPTAPQSNQTTLQDSLGGEPDPDGRSLALQDLYATDTVKDAFARISLYNTPAMSDAESDDDDDDEDDNDEEWEDNMDPITFMRYFATRNPNPTITKLVEDYDREERARLDSKISGWTAGIMDVAEIS